MFSISEKALLNGNTVKVIAILENGLIKVTGEFFSGEVYPSQLEKIQ